MKALWKACLGASLFLIIALAGTWYMEGASPTPLLATQEATALETDLYDRLFDDDIHHSLHITLTEEEWLGMGQDMEAFRRTDDRMRVGEYRHASLVYKDPYGEYAIDDIGIRTKGNTSRLIPEDREGVLRRSHFKLKFDATFDALVTDEDYQTREKRTFLGLNELILKSNMTSDRSFIHEKFAYDLLRRAGVPAPKITLVAVTFYVGERTLDYGVYTMIEPVGKKFLTRRYGTHLDDGNLYKALWQDFGPAALMPIVNPKAVGIKDWKSNYRPSYDLLTNTDQVSHEVLYDFIDQLWHLKDEALKAYLDAHVDVEGLLQAFAVNVLVGTPDDYRSMGNNYYLYFKPDQQVVFMPFDYDNSLGYGWDGVNFGGYEGIATADIYEWKSLASLFVNKTIRHPLAEKVLAIPAYRLRYENILKTLIEDGSYSYEAFEDLFNHFYALYQDDIENDTSTGNQMFITNEAWFMNLKIESVLNQLNQD